LNGEWWFSDDVICFTMNERCMRSSLVALSSVTMKREAPKLTKLTHTHFVDGQH